MWGALSLLMTLIPSFRDFRFLNVVALAGTGFTAIYICVSAGVHGFQHNAVNLAPYNFQSFFTGANVFLWAYGGHGVSFEVSCPLLYCQLDLAGGVDHFGSSFVAAYADEGAKLHLVISHLCRCPDQSCAGKQQ